MKKTYNSENVGKKKSFVNNGTIFFFEIRNYSINVFEITSVRVLLNKEGLLKLASNKSVKTACICIVFFFFHYFKYYGQNIFSRRTVLYLIAKVERKE